MIFQEVQASSLRESYSDDKEIAVSQDTRHRNAVLRSTFRIESTDGILPFELRKSGKSEDEMFNLTEKLYLKTVPDIIENYKRSKDTKASRYLRSNQNFDKGIREVKSFRFYDSHVHSYEHKSAAKTFMDRIEERPIQSCPATRRCAIRVIVSSGSLRIRDIIRKAKNHLKISRFHDQFSKHRKNTYHAEGRMQVYCHFYFGQWLSWHPQKENFWDTQSDWLLS